MTFKVFCHCGEQEKTTFNKTTLKGQYEHVSGLQNCFRGLFNFGIITKDYERFRWENKLNFEYSAKTFCINKCAEDLGIGYCHSFGMGFIGTNISTTAILGPFKRDGNGSTTVSINWTKLVQRPECVDNLVITSGLGETLLHDVLKWIVKKMRLSLSWEIRLMLVSTPTMLTSKSMCVKG